MILENATRKDFKQIKRLFITAFPKEERPPFFVLKQKRKSGTGELLVAKDNNKFVGFIHLVHYKDLIYLFFFAIHQDLRGKGYGSQVLQQLIAKYKDKRIFLAREPLDDNADNNAQRISRRQFYIKNGFTDLPIHIVEADYVFDAMGVNCQISAKDYLDLMLNWGGKSLQRKINMHVIPKQ
jgi:ribosomal protein S18 acetylase RimI-like enzyme